MQVVEPIDDLWRYVLSCFSTDYSSAVCRTYWNWVADGAFALAGFIIVVVGWSLFRQYSAFWRGRLHSKSGDTIDLDSVEMEEKFRAALEKRKAELRNAESDRPDK